MGSLRHRAVGTEDRLKSLVPLLPLLHFETFSKSLTSLALSFGLENSRYLPDQSCYDYEISILISLLPTHSLTSLLSLEPFNLRKKQRGKTIGEKTFINAGSKSRDFESERVTNKI